MTLLGKPIPPLDHDPNPFGAPPGIEVDFDALKAWDGTTSPFWTTRPIITPRLLVVHTNGGSGEGSIEGAIGWGNMAKNNTKPHYHLNARQPKKVVPSDRRGIANSTPLAKELEYNVPDCSFWSLAVETADRGTAKGGTEDLGDFLYNHAELLARIIAYESIVWKFPISVPSVWTGSGVVTHVEPFDGVYTIYTGKSCPGLTKRERVLRGDILPRAREIRKAWTKVTPPPPLPGEYTMKRSWPARIDSRTATYQKTLEGGEVRSVWIAASSVGMQNAEAATMNVTVLPDDPTKGGHLAIWPEGDYELAAKSGMMTTVNWSPGTKAIANQVMVPLDSSGNLLIRATRTCDFIIDIPGFYWA